MRSLPRSLLVALAIVAPALAQESPKPKAADAPAPSKDEVEVRAVVDALLKAFAAKDADAIAELFTENARVVDADGNKVEGRAAIRERFVQGFADDPEAKLEIDAGAIRFPAPNVAIEEGSSRLRSGDDPGAVDDYEVLYLRGEDGKWRQAMVQERPGAVPPTPAERLAELAWLVGEWVDEGGGARVDTTIAWVEGQCFLERTYKVVRDNQDMATGTQRIGWDPVARKIRSWAFDSRGGFSEATWTRDGDRWVIKAAGATADGRPMTATNVLARVGADMAHWMTTDRTVGDEVVDEVEEFTLVRKPPPAR